MDIMPEKIKHQEATWDNQQLASLLLRGTRLAVV